MGVGARGRRGGMEGQWGWTNEVRMCERRGEKDKGGGDIEERRMDIGVLG